MIHFEAEIFESYKYIKTFSFKKQLSAILSLNKIKQNPLNFWVLIKFDFKFYKKNTSIYKKTKMLQKIIKMKIVIC